MKKTIIAFMAFATLVMVGCGTATSPIHSPLQERCSQLGNLAIDANVSSVVRFMVCDSTRELVNARYKYHNYTAPTLNSNFKFEPGSLAHPLFLSAVEEIDSAVLLPAVYKRFGDFEVVDTRFVRDTMGYLVDSITLQEAVAITSNVAIVTLLDKQYGHRREELIKRLNTLFDGLAFPESLETSDSVWYSFLQGRGGLHVTMRTLTDAYRQLPTQIVELLPYIEEDIVGLPPSLVVDPHGRVNAMFLGISDDLVGLVIFEGTNIYAEYVQEVFVNLIKNKES